MGQILNPKPTVFTKPTNASILYHTYKDDFRRADLLHGVDPICTESILEKITVIPYVHSIEKKVVVTQDIVTRVVVDLKVKNNKVNVTITCPIEDLYTKYYSKGVKPPLKERILVYSKIGYSDQRLAKMIKFEDEQKKKLAETEKFIESIFGDSNKKKTSTVPKKKTLLQLIGYKKLKYATNDDNDNENGI